MTENPYDLLGTAEAADYLGVSPGTLRNWRRDNVIAPAEEHPKLLLWRRSDLDKILAKRGKITVAMWRPGMNAQFMGGHVRHVETNVHWDGHYDVMVSSPYGVEWHTGLYKNARLTLEEDHD